MARSIAVLLGIAACGAVVVGAALAARSFQPVRVVGGSMRPALESGDLVFVDRGGLVRSGDVVLIGQPGRGAVLHRAERQAVDGSWVTRGDANPVADLNTVAAPSVRGRVVAVLPIGKALSEWREVAGGATLANQSDSTRQ